MKIFNSIFLLLVSVNFCLANVWQGDYLIQTQADADAFTRVCDCTIIEGDLVISGKDIVHIDSLYTLTAVNGSIDILANEKLNNFNGFQNLSEIKGSLTFANNQTTTIDGFGLLQSIGNSFIIRENENLEKISGFLFLDRIENDISVSLNPALKKFNVFNRLQNCKGIRLYKNESLTSIAGNFFLFETENIEILGHKGLKRIEGFYRLETVRSRLDIIENPALDTISAFRHLKRVGSLAIKDNNELSLMQSAFKVLEEVSDVCTILLPQDIINENHFPNLKTVGVLETNMTNFQNLEYIYTLKVSEKLFSKDTLSGFSRVKKIGNLQIENNDKIKYIYGFNALEEATCIEIYNNSNLKEISGFNALKSVNAIANQSWQCFEIINNPSLQTITGFNQLKNITGGLEINSNDSLTTINAFDELEKVTGDFIFKASPAYLSENYFEQLKEIKGSIISNFTDFKALEKVSIVRIEFDKFNRDTLRGYPALKYAWLIFIGGNSNSLTHIDAFPELEVSSINIVSNNQLKSVKGFDKLHTIQSDLLISKNPSLEDISAFGKIRQVKNMEIKSNLKLNNIPGFQNLVTADHISISNLNSQNLSIFDNLSHIEQLEITNNRQIQSISAFKNLKSAENIYINSNTNLQEINGFKNLESTERIVLNSNTNLLSIDGFNQLKSLNFLYIISRNLRKLDAFSNLEVVNNLLLTDNIQLRSIDNFSNISFIAEQLSLTNNLQLNSCCIINCWLKQKDFVGSNLIIENNGTSCSDLNSIKTACDEESECNENELTLSDLKTNNPVTKQLQFSFLTFEDQTINYTIYNINEQVIRKGSVMGNKGINSKTIDVPETERGYYFLQLEGKNSKEVVKFLKL